MTRAKDISKILTDADISGNIDVDGVTNLDVVDIDGAVDMASTLQVDGAITSSTGMTITTADNTDQLTLVSTDGDAGEGPNLVFYRNSSSPADGDDLSTIDFIGRNDNSQNVTYGQIKTVLLDASDGTEDARLEFYRMIGGVSSPDLQLNAEGVVINEGSNDRDFRVEGNGDANAFFVEGETDNIGIGNNDPADKLHVYLASGQRVARFEANNSTSSHIAFKASNTSLMPTVGVKDEVLYFSTGDAYERARILGPSTSHGGFFKISDAGSYQGSTSGSHEIRSSSSNETGVIIGATHASYSSNVISIITQRANSSTFHYIQAFSSNTGDTDYRVRGDGDVFADGNFSSGGADYAEMFEWKDGNTSSEDRVGKTVVLDGNQIRLSTSDDAQATIIGVVSARPVVLGDAQSEKWKDKYETDSYGRYVFEEYTQTEWTEETDDGAKELKSYQTDIIPSDVTVPDDAIVTSKDENGDNLKRRKLNSAFDASKTYIPREDRKEFSAIGLVGKLRVSVGQRLGDRWIKMREISDTVHEYLVR